MGLLASEIALQLAALIAARGVASGDGPLPAGAVTILVVGDSHAAGGGAAPEESLPAHLERILAARHPTRTFRIVNAGLSGVNSAWVANRLEHNIDRYRADLVIVWVGVNNRWNLTESEDRGAGGWRVALHRLLLYSRLYRLVAVAWHTGGWQVDSRAGLVWQSSQRLGPSSAAALRHGLTRDVERMTRLAIARRRPIVFMQYPVPFTLVNRTIAATTARLGVPSIRTADDLARAQQDGHDFAALVTLAAGPHPTGLLYRYVAESTADEVDRLLRGDRRFAE